ncbi:MAG: metalloregulator ArsR/SmtB family transcription factor [Chloroflexota bacterium]|nr:metalloregulator ArsR/SmtB family transcription factor [Chloroflexota bacterium]
MVRTTTENRRLRAASVPVVARAIVRDFSRSTSKPEITFDARTAYDFVISLNVVAGEDADLLPEDAAWLTRARASLPDPLRHDLESCFGAASSGAFHALPSFIVARPDVTDATSFLAALDESTPEALARSLLLDHLRPVGLEDLLDPIMDGDSAAVSTAMERFDESEKSVMAGFLREPIPAVTRMRATLDAWLPLYVEVEPRIAQMLERDVAARKSDRASLDQDTLIERTTGGLRFLPEPQVRRVILAPSYFARPFNYTYQGADWRIFGYPIADAVVEAGDAGVPPQAVVRLYRALGDGTRMRILKLLADRDWYLTELAQQLELSKPTMKHHLALLRAAGLVTVTEEGNLTYYSLRRERLEEAGVELRRFLG